MSSSSSSSSPVASSSSAPISLQPLHQQRQSFSDHGMEHGPKPQVMNEERTLQNKGDLLCPHPLSCLLSSLLPCAWCCACTEVKEKTENVVLTYGKLTGVMQEPGLTCYNPCGSRLLQVSTAMKAANIPNLKVLDAMGCPLLVSAVVTYEVFDAARSVLCVDGSVQYFVVNQGEVVLKQICALHPYEAKTPGGDSLKREADKVRREIVELLQARVNGAGVRIINFQFKELSYAPEIAAQMLVKQQAQAMLEARRTVVEGAVSIAVGAIQALKEKGLGVTEAEQSRLTSNLLITICSETRVTPTMHIS